MNNISVAVKRHGIDTAIFNFTVGHVHPSSYVKGSGIFKDGCSIGSFMKDFGGLCSLVGRTGMIDDGLPLLAEPSDGQAFRQPYAFLVMC